MPALRGQRGIALQEGSFDDQRIGAAHRFDQRVDLFRVADYGQVGARNRRCEHCLGLDPAAVGQGHRIAGGELAAQRPFRHAKRV